MEKWYTFLDCFWMVWEPFCDHFEVKIASKNRSKNQCDFGTISERFWTLPGVQVGSPAGSGMLPGRSQDAPRRSQEAPKMLPRRSRTPIRHPKRPQESPRHFQARFWTISHWNFVDLSLIFSSLILGFFHWFFIDVLICWDYSGSILGVFWKYSGNILGLFWEYSGSVLGKIGEHSVTEG